MSNLSSKLQDPYYSRHDGDGNAVATISLIMIGMVLGLVFLTAVKSCIKDPVLVVLSNNCRSCHFPDLSTYKKYKAHHRVIDNSQALLTELVRP